jgi:hypothetical protein
VAKQFREEQSRVAASLRDQTASLTSKMETLLNQTSEATVPAQSTIRRTTAPASTSRTSTQSTPAPNVSLRTNQHRADRDLVYEDSLDVLEARNRHGRSYEIIGGTVCHGNPTNCQEFDMMYKRATSKRRLVAAREVRSTETEQVTRSRRVLYSSSLGNWQKRQQLPTSPKGMSTAWLRSWLEEM